MMKTLQQVTVALVLISMPGVVFAGDNAATRARSEARMNATKLHFTYNRSISKLQEVERELRGVPGKNPRVKSALESIKKAIDEAKVGMRENEKVQRELDRQVHGG